MAEKDDLKRILRAAALAANKFPTERQLNEAAEELEKKIRVTKSDIQELGEKVASNAEIFATTDIGDINDVLERGRKK